MAEYAYLKLKNDTTGEDVPGDPIDTSKEGYIEVVAFEQETIRPTHAKSGQVTGETTYGGLMIRKPIDQASPLLQAGLAEGNKWTGSIEFYKTTSGKTEHYYTISFSKATLVGVKMYKPLMLDAAYEGYPDLEEIQFRFVQIGWRHEQASKEASADWSARAK